METMELSNIMFDEPTETRPKQVALYIQRTSDLFSPIEVNNHFQMNEDLHKQLIELIKSPTVGADSKLTIYVNSMTSKKEESFAIELLQSSFKRELDNQKYAIKSNINKILISLICGGAFLVPMIYLSGQMVQDFQSNLSVELLKVGSWMLLWTALYTIVFDCIPVTKTINKLNKIVETIKIMSKDSEED